MEEGQQQEARLLHIKHVMEHLQFFQLSHPLEVVEAVVVTLHLHILVDLAEQVVAEQDQVAQVEQEIHPLQVQLKDLTEEMDNQEALVQQVAVEEGLSQWEDLETSHLDQLELLIVLVELEQQL